MQKYPTRKCYLKFVPALLITALIGSSHNAFAQTPASDFNPVRPVALQDVRIHDAFWSPKFRTWTSKTVYDVFDKLEGKYIPDRKDIIEEKEKLGRTRNAFLNFDRVAHADKDTKQFDGPPWYDGLVYESIRGAADLLKLYPDKKLEAKIDRYIDRIATAQAADPDGYIDTYTTLNRSHQRWGTNGGDDKWQHDIYNAGMLAEAAVHYYRATGKTKLLNVAAKMSNYMFSQMGPAPKLNVIPGHGGPEEALLKLYQLFKEQPALKQKIQAPVQEQQYYDLAKFWIENRGNYGEPGGSYARNSDGSYNQDQMPVLQQQTIEGHAVRATLLATGVAAIALENKDSRYMKTAENYWNNMVGKRMFITGGEGAVADQEKFGPDYFLPESSYLETCASIGAGFFSQRMNQLTADGKYVDELERVLYNNLLSGVSLSGDHYFYENPLIASEHQRWAWHSCPCCPPMILKMVSALPEFIYSSDKESLFVNLFIGSTAKMQLPEQGTITLQQKTEYPWKGVTRIEVLPERSGVFTIKVRIPGWARGKENPYDLYISHASESAKLAVNGKPVAIAAPNGYVSIKRFWKKGDFISLSLPVQPRLVTPNDSVEALRGKMAIAAGPVVYGLEAVDNGDLKRLFVNANTRLKLSYQPGLLHGVNVITGYSKGAASQSASFKAIPFYSLANREAGSPYQVWLPVIQGRSH